MKGTSIFLALVFFCASLLTSIPLTASETPPIDLVNFEVQLDNRNVIINWVTAEEVTTDMYYIERSLDGTNFSIVGEAEGAGNSTVEIKYFYMDILEPTISGTVYYRFTQTDLDGTSSTSSIKSISAPPSGINPFTPVMINPVTVDITQISDIVIQEGNTSPFVNIFDLNGKLVHSKRQEIWNEITIPQDLPKGHYIVDIRNQNTRFVTRFIKA